MNTFGSRLRMAITCAGSSVAKLAKARGVTPQTVRDWCRMEEADLSAKHLIGICLELGVATIWLAIGVGSPTPIWLADVRKARFAAKV